MNGLTQRNRSDNQRQTVMADRPRRWRAWARTIAGSLPTGRPGITRRRVPLKLTLRRSRPVAWIVQRNTFVHQSAVYQSAKNSSVVVKPVLRLSLHWTRTAASFKRTFVWTTPSDTAPAMPETIRGAVPAPAVDLIHRWTLREQRTQSKTPQREIVERTRRLEERIRVEKRLVARGAASSAAISERQDAARRAGPDWWKSDTPMRSQRAAPAPEINVDQIAETVMRRIGQRVSAWRERMGRM